LSGRCIRGPSHTGRYTPGEDNAQESWAASFASSAKMNRFEIDGHFISSFPNIHDSSYWQSHFKSASSDPIEDPSDGPCQLAFSLPVMFPRLVAAPLPGVEFAKAHNVASRGDASEPATPQHHVEKSTGAPTTDRANPRLKPKTARHIVVVRKKAL
jgi:hypothetical protein